ncbi:hypothetical protein KCA24_33355, partial [Escherichia coli]|nr:hypothetical protein [Escherichia coli]
MAFHLHLRHTQLPMHIDTAPYPAPAGTITSTSDSSSQYPNALLYELICNKTAAHIKLFANIWHQIRLFSPHPGLKTSNTQQYSKPQNLPPPPPHPQEWLKHF